MLLRANVGSKLNKTLRRSAALWAEAIHPYPSLDKMTVGLGYLAELRP